MSLPPPFLENNVHGAVWSSTGDTSLLVTTAVVEGVVSAFRLKPFLI